MHPKKARPLHLADEAVFALQLYQIESLAWQEPYLANKPKNFSAFIVWSFLHPLVTVGGTV